MSDIAELREQLEPTDIKRIIGEYGYYPYTENNVYIVFPTCCHNIDEGSPKLYYYLNSHLFVCYTHCGSFDIFELIIKMEKLRGNDITLTEAIQRTGITLDSALATDEKELRQANQYIERLQDIVPPQANTLKNISRSVLDKYSNDEELLNPWIEEGMTKAALRRFEIKYDKMNVAIVIPHKDINGNIVGVRGRFMEENAPNKYMPLTYTGQFMAHSLKDNLYGIYENKEAIMKSKTVFIFESEKSVILFDSYFGKEKNYAVATCGNKISKQQIELLERLGVAEVVLCFDKDYTNYNDMLNIQSKYIKICEHLASHFKTSIIMDYGDLLNYKDSPIDEGPDVFKELYKFRYYL